MGDSGRRGYNVERWRARRVAVQAPWGRMGRMQGGEDQSTWRDGSVLGT